MKKVLSLVMMAAAVLFTVACEKTEKPIDVTVQLTVDDQNYAAEGVKVVLEGAAAFEATTDAQGVASFTVPVGIYEASTSFKKIENDNVKNYNGVATVTVGPEGETAFTLPLTVSVSTQLVIKEIYTDGCQKNDASGEYANDKYLILYNNSDVEYDATDLCIGNAYPSNAHGANAYYNTEGVLAYTDWMPSGWAFWGFKTTVKIPAYSQIVVSIFGAIDHTVTYTNSVDLSTADYVMYDPESGFNNATMYPAPAEGIPATNHMAAYKYGQGNAWAIGNFSPALYVFKMDATTAAAFILDKENNLDYTCGEKMPNAKIPVSSIVDGVESFNFANLAKSKTRFVASVDAGHVNYTKGKGYSLYRNVDKDATEALPENAGKLVYDYAGGTADEEGGSTDPSGIDAEASIAAGAHIIYMDTNNSTNDFHQRKVASIKK